ncbi:Bifunctional dehydrogenase and ferrochelatase [Orbilia brochopaga]|uniref:precorrin-2 dehydrogenase n=1 Tax=Orbilia brochopaga TaxID=3140254 RepID=A0AAV9UUI3_9PEZI
MADDDPRHTNTPPAPPAGQDTPNPTTTNTNTVDTDTTDESFPPITPGGSLMLAWQPRDRPILLVGGGNVAASRLDHLLNASATSIILIAPPPLHPSILHRLHTHPSSITHHPRLFLPSDLTTTPPPSLILTAVDDPAVSSAIHALAVASNIPINVADVPPLCDFYFGAIHRAGPLQIMVSTNGNGPRLAASIRDRIADSLPKNIPEAIANVGILRKKLRNIASAGTTGEISKRMAFMSAVCDSWSFEQLAEMTEADMDVILAGYPDGTVKSYDDVKKVETLMAAVHLGEAADNHSTT